MYHFICLKYNFSRDRRRNKFENILSKYYKRKLRVRSGSIKNATRKAIYKTMQTISKHISDGPIKIHCVIFRNHSPRLYAELESVY